MSNPPTIRLKILEELSTQGALLLSVARIVPTKVVLLCFWCCRSKAVYQMAGRMSTMQVLLLANGNLMHYDLHHTSFYTVRRSTLLA